MGRWPSSILRGRYGTASTRRTSSRTARLGTHQQFGELGGVVDCLVAVAVVHEQVDLAAGVGELVHLRHPLAQLVVGVAIAEPHRRRNVAPFPHLVVAPVEA